MTSGPDKQDKCVNEVISCQPQKQDKYDHEIIPSKDRRNIFYRTKSTENNFKPSKVRDFALPVIILILATIVIAVTNADLRTSAPFCIDGTWPIGEQQPWHLLYLLNRGPSITLGSAGLAAALIGCIYRQRRSWIRPGLFLALLLALGPGLVVNSVFKEYWGRPRPREIVQFGGKKEFLQPWQKGIAHGGRSFPSGHSSAAFYFSAPFFLLRRRKPRTAALWMTGGLLFGTFMSIARITQGGHFLSDNLWAWGIVHLTAVALYYLLRLDRDEPPSAPS